MRLDIYLVTLKLAESRSKALQLIKNESVSVNDKVITKAGYDVKENDKVLIKENDVLEFVSRGGLKLKKAISYFSLDLTDKVICDIGSSTGGFTDCALKNKARKVYSIDVGSSQLHHSLRNRNDVIVLENTNFRFITKDIFKDKIDLYVCDVSFISIRTILKKLIELENDFSIVLLFKPQFEVGPKNLNKNGVVKNDTILKDCLVDFLAFLNAYKLYVHNFTFSPITGNKEGNIEFLFYIKTEKSKFNCDLDTVMNEAITKLK